MGFLAISQNSLLQKSTILGKIDFCGPAWELHHYSIGSTGKYLLGPNLNIGYYIPPLRKEGDNFVMTGRVVAIGI